MQHKTLGKIAIVLLLVFAAFGCNQNMTNPIVSNTPANTPSSTPTSQQDSPFVPPISNAKARITKKPFGVYVSPSHSPVTPEKFTGYHTGVDFETTPDEQNSDVDISAICDGKVLEARYASGYGGVLVQACELDNSPITLVYGHLRQSSFKVKVGDRLGKGQQFAVLGTGFSPETDGERKHLHLGIHKGSSANIKGYVQSQSELSAWINFADYLQ